MFQNAWYDKREDSKTVEKSKSIPSTFIKTNEIEEVAILYWDEHCLECSAPACYTTCSKYRNRKDGLCKRLVYGIKHERPIQGLLWNVRIKFREWGKLEARINKGTLPPEEVLKLSEKDAIRTHIFSIASAVLTHSDRKICTQWDGLKRKKYAQIESRTAFANDFLFQCFSFENQEYRLNLEITDNENNVIYKTGFQIIPGFNQIIIKLEFIPPEGGLIRFYPEKNIEAELQIYSADLVKLKHSIPELPSKKIKCIAWDLDKTIWDGILAESKPEDLELRPLVKETIEELDRRGIIQIVVSKNDVGAVDSILENLEIKKYFVYILSNWNSKSVNLYNVARMLNINIDTFGLIDDSQFERKEVSETLPCVRVFDEDLTKLLSHSEFEVAVTSESIKRRESYQQEASRKEVLANSFSGNNTEFIRNCQIKIIIRDINSDEEKKRSYELLQRTNQLNLSAKKYSQDEFSDILQSPGKAFVVFVNDKFGDYGQVAFGHFEVSEEVVIDEFAMSCRVAGKYIEPTLMKSFLRTYSKDVVMTGHKTNRNQTLIDALIKCGFIDQSGDGDINMVLRRDINVPFSDINTIVWEL